MSNQPPKTRPPARRVNNGGGSASTAKSNTPPPRRPATNVNAPRRDPFPYVLGGILALMVVGIFLVVFLISSGGSTNTNPNGGVAQAPATATAGNSGVVPPATVAPGSSDAGAPTAAGSTPPRMPLADFKAIYDDPAKRANTLIIDVRAKESYEAGHITGAESWPEADIDATVVKLPKDKLIVAYCQ